jgi:hypothetical protein
MSINLSMGSFIYPNFNKFHIVSYLCFFYWLIMGRRSTSILLLMVTVHDKGLPFRPDWMCVGTGAAAAAL